MTPRRGPNIAEALKSYDRAQAVVEEMWVESGATCLTVEGPMLQLRAIGLGINASVLLLKELHDSLPTSTASRGVPESLATTHNKHVYRDSKQGDDDELLSIAQAVDESGYSLATLRRWGDAGKLEVHRTPGGQRRFRRSDLQKIHRKQS